MLKFILENNRINREFMEAVYHFEANNTPFPASPFTNNH